MIVKKITLPNFTLIAVNKNNSEHLKFLKELFRNPADKQMDFLGHLDAIFDENTFIVEYGSIGKIGYFSKSNPVVNGLNLSSVSLYYAISPKYRENGYATALLQELSKYFLEENDMLVLKIHKDNIASIKVAEGAGFEVSFKSEEEEDIIYTKYACKKIN